MGAPGSLDMHDFVSGKRNVQHAAGACVIIGLARALSELAGGKKHPPPSVPPADFKAVWLPDIGHDYGPDVRAERDAATGTQSFRATSSATSSVVFFSPMS